MLTLDLETTLGSEDFLNFEKRCLQIKSQCSSSLKQNISIFESASEKIKSSVSNFQYEVSLVPLLSAILVWAKKTNSDHIFGKRHLSLMEELISTQLIPILDSQLLNTLKQFSESSHDFHINNIRGHSAWYLQKREDAVSLYVSFSNWLSETTLGYVKRAFDPDRLTTAKRAFAFEKYIELLSHLPERERIIAKLFYLGGARSLEDVLSLKVNDIDFVRNSISYPENTTKYPLHVIEDLKTLLGTRKKGFVFANKLDSNRIHHTVPYRAIKKVAHKLGLPTEFSYKNLVENI